MKLVSRFKDYYDSLRSMDRDPEPVYVRATTTYRDGEMSDEQQRAADRLWTPLTVMPNFLYGVERGVLGFCGRLFPFYICGPTVCYRQAQLEEAIEAWRNGSDPQRVYIPPRRELARTLHDLEREWGLLVDRIDDDPFLEFRSPVLWRRERELVTNPILKPLQFAQRVDAYTAWQELSMFLGNNMVAASTVAPRPISDELKAEAKGFDTKTSFRNQKNRKKSERGDW